MDVDDQPLASDYSLWHFTRNLLDKKIAHEDFSMKRKLASIFAWVSTALFAVFVGLYIYAWVCDPNLYPMYSDPPPRPFFFHIPLGNATMSVDKYDGGQVVFYNGPKPNDGTMSGSSDDQTGWGFYGMECGLMRVNDPVVKTWWTLRISLWYPIIIFGILPAIFVVKKLRNRKSASTKKETS